MITNTVEKWRKEKGVTKAHMARQVGVKRSYMTKLEKGQLQPSGDMMFRISEYLKQPLQNVFQYVQSKITTPAFLSAKRCLTGKQISRPDSEASGNEQSNNAETMKG